jgi:hypothetical protein
MKMLLVQADVVTGVYEMVNGFGKEATVMEFNDFIAYLPRILDYEIIGCALTNQADIDRLEAEYGIYRFKG